MEEEDSILVDLDEKEVPASYFQRLFVSIIDVIFSIGFILLIYKLLPEDIVMKVLNATAISRFVVIILVMTVYRLILLLVFGKTIGMMVCRVKYLNADYKPLNPKQILIASFASLTSTIKFYKNK